MATSQTLSRWASLSEGEITVDNVQQILNSIRDDLWVAAACVDKIVDSVPVQRILLQIGEERTLRAMERIKDALTFSSSAIEADRNDGEERSDSSVTNVHRQHDLLVAYFREVPTDAQLCHLRVVILERLDRLNTYVDMCNEVGENEEGEFQDGIEEWGDDPWTDVASSVVQGSPKPTELPLSLVAFLTDGLLHTSCLLASHQWFGPLRVLFRRHGSYLWPYRFVILENIPEHAQPSSYLDLLPSLDPSTNSEPVTIISNGWRNAEDWSETPEVRSAVAASDAPTGAHLSSDALLSGGNSHPNPLSADELTTWYRNRIDRILSSTGMVDMALATVQHAASYGIVNLDELGEELSLLSRLVYDTPRADTDADDDWTLSRWKSTDPPSILRAYLSHSTPDTLPTDISRLVLPYLFVLESRAERAGKADPSLPTRLLYDYILSAPLRMAEAIFEASKLTLPAAQRLIRNDEDIVRLALACLYGSDSLDEWSTMSRIFECLPAWDNARNDENGLDAVDTTVASLVSFVTPSTTRPRCTASDLLIFFKPLPLVSLSHALDILDVHLESGEILSRWGVPAPLRWFLQSIDDPAEQRAWANRMARRAGNSKGQLDTLEDWDWLLEDMLKLSGKSDSRLRGAFGLLSRDEVTRIFLSGLLSTGNFSIAKSLLHSPKNKLHLDSESVEDICVSCSHEFYDNASSGNYTFGDMKLAHECLDVPPPSDRIQKEKDFIEATSRLSSFNIMSRPGIPISPIEIRLTKDRLSLVSRVLSSNADAYKHTEVILDLVHKLGFRDDAAAEVKALAMLADTALQVEDFNRAFEINGRIVDTVLQLQSSTPMGHDDPKVQEASDVCWVACFQLGRQPEFDDVDKKLSLLGRTVDFCPPEKLHDVLTVWRRLEKEDIQNREERLSYRRSEIPGSVSQKRKVHAQNKVGFSLRTRLQDFHMPAPPLLNTPDAAALASRTFRSVAATFPFSVGGRGRSHTSQQDDERARSSSGSRFEGEAVSTQATRVFQKGIGWLIGAEEDS